MKRRFQTQASGGERVRSGPVLRERRMMAQFNPPSSNSGANPKTTASTRRMRFILCLRLLNLLKRALGLFGEANSRPNDPRKVWSQNLPPAALQCNPIDENTETGEATGAPDDTKIDSVCPPKSQQLMSTSNYWFPIEEIECKSVPMLRGMSFLTYPSQNVAKG